MFGFLAILLASFTQGITGFGFATNIFAIILFTLEGIINTQVVHFTISYLPALIIGVFAGIKVSSKINEQIFRKITIYLIALLGLYTAISS